jgi:hypothetical protein
LDWAKLFWSWPERWNLETSDSIAAEFVVFDISSFLGKAMDDQALNQDAVARRDTFSPIVLV